MDEGRYTYCGRIELVGKPYTETQPGEDGKNRLVWMFPVRPVPENNVKKPAIFVFKDMHDYRARGKNADAEDGRSRRGRNQLQGKQQETGCKIRCWIERLQRYMYGEKRVLPLIGVEESDTIDANESACLIKALFCGGRSRE